MRWWKWVGLAGLVGAAAVGAGVMVSRRHREIVDYDVEELRQRLHRRHEEGQARRTAAAG